MARLLFLTIGFHKPSTRARVLGSLEYLESRGHEVRILEIPSNWLQRLILLPRLRAFDLVIVQKKLPGPWQVRAMKSANPNLLFDMDDAVMFHEIERGEPVAGKFFRRFTVMAAECRGVIAGNRYLSDFAGAARGPRRTEPAAVVVLPTSVDLRGLRPKDHGPTEGSLRIGWIGTRGNLGHLKSIEAPLKAVLSSFPGSRLAVVSDGEPRVEGVPVEYKAWRADEEMEDLHSFDVGIMPLVDSLWTRGKGGFKLLQYMAAGVPAVASAVGINNEIIRHGENGFLARDSAEWERALSRLLGDGALRRRMGMAGRATVEDSYSLDHYNQRLAAFLESFL